MKREHFEHVKEYFGLIDEWCEETYPDITSTDLYIERKKFRSIDTDTLWWICDASNFIFNNIDTKEQAEQILEHFKATEIMFV